MLRSHYSLNLICRFHVIFNASLPLLHRLIVSMHGLFPPIVPNCCNDEDMHLERLTAILFVIDLTVPMSLGTLIFYSWPLNSISQISRVTGYVYMYFS